jgi:hypothetical protein
MKIEEMKRALEEYQMLSEAWRNVEIVTKKDGTPFKTLKRNFKNCVFYEKYGLQHVGVSISKDRHYYHDDFILLTEENVKTIKEHIDSRIRALNKYEEEYKEAVNAIENNTIDIDKLAEDIMNSIKEKCGYNQTATTVYKFKLMEKLKEKH